MNSFENFVASGKARVRSAPLPSLGGAVALGFVLTRLPIIAVVFGTLRLATALLRPVLLVLGLLKARDLIQARQARTPTRSDPGS